MIAVRDQIEKVKDGSVEHWHLLNVLRRFQELREDAPVDGERQILEDTRKLLDSSNPTELLYDALIYKHEVEAILKALFRYICSDIGDMEGRIKFLMHHSISHTIRPSYRKVKRR
jgi:hypothetical protein